MMPDIFWKLGVPHTHRYNVRTHSLHVTITHYTGEHTQESIHRLTPPHTHTVQKDIPKRGYPIKK